MFISRLAFACGWLAVYTLAILPHLPYQPAGPLSVMGLLEHSGSGLCVILGYLTPSTLRRLTSGLLPQAA